MPVEECSALGTLQALVNEKFYDYVKAFVLKYIDDRLNVTKNRESHYEYLKIVLVQLRNYLLCVSHDQRESREEEARFLVMPNN